MRDRANQRVPRPALPGPRVNSDPRGPPANGRERGVLRIAASPLDSTILSALALISVLPIPLHEYSRARLMG